MPRFSGTAATKKLLEKWGYTVGTVEQTISRPGTKFSFKRDLFNFADQFAFNETEVVLIQVTSGANHAARRKKILANHDARRWLTYKTGERSIWIVSWTKKKDGKHQERIEVIDRIPF